MFVLAWQTIRAHRAGFIAAFVAVFCGSVLITACGILIDSGQRGGVPPQRYASAQVVVTAPQEVSTEFGMTQRFAERVRLPASHVDTVAGVPGVRDAVGDVSVRAGVRTGTGTEPLTLHGWSSAQLDSTGELRGRPPKAPGEVVLGGGSGVRPGDTVEVEIGGAAAPYRVVGIAATADGQAFLTDRQARDLSGHPDHVDAIAVLAGPGVSVDELARRVADAVPDATVSTGDDRAEAEFLDVGEGRAFLVLMAGSFGGTMLLIVLLVVASTLGLSVQQRRREFALLRAIAATPRQIYRLVAAETAVLSTVAALLGAVPGVGLSLLLRDVLADLGAVPADFEFVIGPLPVLIAVAACVAGAVLAGLVAARRAARLSPVAALGEAAVEPARLGRGRVLTGVLLVVGGTGAGIALPLFVGGPAAVGGAAGSALLLVVGVALLGPRLLTATTTLLRGLGAGRTAAGWLAHITARANSRRLGSATTPLIMGVALASVQIFTATTTSDAARTQADTGLVADHVLVSERGIAPSVVDNVRDVSGATVTPVVHTDVLVTYDEFGEPTTETYPAQGVAPARLDDVMDLDVRSGSVAELSEGTVAVSRSAADTFSVDVGSSLTLRLGDGTEHTARVVAVYGSGLGFGDVTLPDDVVVAHTTDRLYDYVLVDGADPEALQAALASHPEVTVTDRSSFTAARQTGQSGQATVNLVLNLVLLAFIAIAVVNILVLATAARVREFALLRLVGARTSQVRAMMHGEGAIVVTASVVFGSLAALPPLVGISLSLTGSAVPSVPPLIYLAVVAVALVLGWCSIAFPTRFALRTKPVAALGVGE